MARRRRWLRILLGALGALLGVVALAALALQSGRVRQRVADALIGFANDAMDEKLILDGVDGLTPWGVNVRHVILNDEHGHLIVDAYGVTATIDVTRLLWQHVDISQANVQRARLALPMIDDPPSNKHKAKKPKKDKTPEEWRVTIPRATVGRTDLALKLPFGTLNAVARDVEGQFFWHDYSRIVVKRARVDAHIDDQQALASRLVDSEWRTDIGGPVQLVGTLGERSKLTIAGHMGGVDVKTPWPQGDLKVAIQELRGDVLALFDLERSWLKKPSNVAVRFVGDTRGLRTLASVNAKPAHLHLYGAWSRSALTGTLAVTPVRAEQISAQLPPGRLGGRLSFDYALGKRGIIEAHWRNVTIADVQVPDAHLRGARLGTQLRIDALRIRGFEQNVRVSGRVALKNGAGTLHAAIDALDLSKLSVLSGPKLQGSLNGAVTVRTGDTLKVDGQLDAKELKLRSVRAKLGQVRLALYGTPEVPLGNASLRLFDLNIPQLPARDVQITAELLQPRIEAHLDAQGDKLAASAHLVVPRKRDRLDLQASQLRADLKAELPAGPLLSQVSPQLSALHGTIRARLHTQGSVAAPQVALQAYAQLGLPERDERAEEISLDLTLDKQGAAAELGVRDLEGGFLSIHGILAESPYQAFGKLKKGAYLPSFKLQLQMAPRRLDLMQGAVAYLAGLYALDLPARVSGKLNLSSQDHDLQGEAALRVVLFGDAIDQRCQAGAHTDVDFDASLKERALSIRATSHGDQGGVVTAELRSALSEKMRLEPATLKVRGERVLLHTLPGLCGLNGGTGELQLDAQGLGTSTPTAKLSVDAQGLSARKGPPLDVTMRGAFDPKQLELTASVRDQQREAARIRLELPVRMNGRTPDLQLNDRAALHASLRDLTVAPFLSVGDQLGRPGGTVSGDIHARGPLQDPQLEGQVSFDRVSLSIAALAQPLRDISGKVAVKGRHFTIEKLSARDRSGSLKLSGHADLARDLSGNIQLSLQSTRFPIRRQGEVVGELSTSTSFKGQLDANLDLTGELKIADGRFWITGQSGAKVESLERHPEVRFVDGQGVAEQKRKQQEEQQEERGDSRDLSITKLRIRSERDLWFMHEDFSVQLAIDLQLVSEQKDEKLLGEVTIRRGQLQLLGKPFTIERGAVRLTGDTPPDPELELRAAFEPPTGETLYVEVHGRASAPIIAFSGAATTAEEAIAIVSGLGETPEGAEQRAQADARGFATNITAGLLSASVRRRLGDWVPLISVQSDVTGAPKTARAGFDASRLIPPVLRKVARGAYVEGIVGNTRERRTGAVGLGIRLEIALPHDFVSSMGYGPGPTWAGDLMWAP